MMKDCIFEEIRHVSYSHISTNKTVGAADILRFCQDSAVSHTAACGYPLERLISLQRAWLVLSMHVRFVKPIALSKDIRVRTWPFSFSRVLGPRAFCIEDAETKEVYVEATSLWAYTDTESGRPAEIPQEMITEFSEGEEPPLSYIRRVPNYEATEHIADFRVLKRDLDTNIHMNNVKYLEYAEEALPLGTTVSEIEIFYKQQAKYGDILSLYASEDAEGNVLTYLKNQNGEICTYIKFIPEKGI